MYLVKCQQEKRLYLVDSLSIYSTKTYNFWG
jgi:hypothetical protein